MVGGAHPTIQRRSAPALFTFATVFVIVEEVLVVVLVVAVDGHANQPDQRTDVERSFLLARGVFGAAADGASAEDRRSKTTQQQTANVHVRPFECRDSDANSAGSLSRGRESKRFLNSPATRPGWLIHRRFQVANSFQVVATPILPPLH